MPDEEMSEFIFTWRIMNYLACYQTKGEYIESPGFTVENLRGSLWCLRFYSKGVSPLEESDHVSCYLKWERSDISLLPPLVDFSIELVVGSDIVLKSMECKHMFKKTESDWGWKMFMSIDELAEEMDFWKEDDLTLRCRMKCDKVKKQIIFGSDASTIIDVHRRFFGWNVTTSFEHSESLVFPFSDEFNFEITLASFVKGLKILVRLKECDEDFSQLIMFKITFYNKKECKIISKHAKYLFKGTEEWEFPYFVSKDLLDSCKFDSGNYKFKLEFEIYGPKNEISFNDVEKLHFNTSYVTCVDTESKASPVTAMQNDFRNLFVNKKYYDVTVKAGNQEFPAHKLVLRVRSPVFEAMFDQNMLENETGVVNVTDIDGKTMKYFLEFLYTEKVGKMDFESAKKLLLAADKYQVPSLVKACVSILKSILSLENALETISIADSVNCECLKLHALDYIIFNAAKILIDPNWKPWIRENPELATDILSKMSTDFLAKYH